MTGRNYYNKENIKFNIFLLILPLFSALALYILSIIFSPSGFKSISYPLHILVMINIYIILGFSINIITGYTGMMSLGHGAFYGLSAYFTALALMLLKFPFLIAVLFAVICNIIISFLISLISYKLKKDYFILAVIAFQIVTYTILYNWTQVTKGPYGISGIPNPVLLGLWKIDSVWEYAILSYLFVILVFFYFYKMDRSAFGRIIKGLRDNEILVSAMGRNINHLKIFAFAISAGIAALSGALFATYATYIDPSSFTLDESFFIITIIFIGGSGNIKGVIFGAVFVEIVPEILRLLRMPDTISANMKQIIFGLILLILMRIRPVGIAGDYDYD